MVKTTKKEEQAKELQRVSEKVEILEKKVDDLQKTQNIILESQNTMLLMIQKISKKLDDEKIEEKAFAYEQNQKIIHNWKFWVVAIPLLMLSGAGILKILEKSDNIATITEAFKK